MSKAEPSYQGPARRPMERLIARFGAPEREMLGILTLPDELPARAAWLLCNPFGQEAVRSKPLYRILAERLAREGSAALRFDFHGTGDSPGELADQSLGCWITDLFAADAWLRSRQPAVAAQVQWFGLRLGASIAALAALQAHRPPDQLLLWDPVLNGSEYGQFLLARHRETRSEGLHISWARLCREFGELEPTLPGNVLGFDVGSALASDLQAMGPLPLTNLLRQGQRMSLALQADRFARLDLPLGATLDRITIQSPIDWSTNDAEGTAIAPQEVQRAVLASGVRQ